MKVDLNLLLSDEEYTPIIGAEYEVSPGRWGILKHPTVALQNKIAELTNQEGANDFSLMQLVLAGVDDITEDDCIPLMPSRVVADFFTLLVKIGEKLGAISAESEEMLKTAQE